jgi:DNA-directed RNA polymerase specialized sigma24 family protein
MRKGPVPAVTPEPDPPFAEEPQLHCLDQCLAELNDPHRELILRYHEGEKGIRIRNRIRLARELGMELNALRIRAHRIRAALQKCVRDCLTKDSG